jgi:Tfp pilus assembly protein PilO
LGVGLLVFIVGYVTDIKFLQTKLHVVKTQRAKSTQLLQNKRQEGQEAKVEQQKIKVLQTQYAAKLNRFANDFGMADILNGLERAAKNSQAELQLLEPQNIIEDEFFMVYPVKLELCGPYKNLLGFVNNVLKQPYFTVVEEFSLQKKAIEDDNDELNMQAVLAVYRNKISSGTSVTNKQLLPNNPIKIPGRDIFAKAVVKANLFLWSCDELYFLGLLKHHQTTYGVVSDPMGKIHRVMVGDKIGLKQSKIIAIDEHGIIAADKADNIYRRE